jgi:hypothetical protein
MDGVRHAITALLTPRRPVVPLMEQQHSFALVGGKQDDTGCFKRPSHLIARRLVHL